jgi:hypothetical protein
MLLVIEKADPERFELAARRWLAMLCEDRQSAVDLLGLAQAAVALDALPTRRPAACAALATVCQRAGAARRGARACSALAPDVASPTR